MNIDINNLVQTLADAQAAQEALPKVKAENESLYRELNTVEAAKTELETTLADLRAKLAQTETALAAEKEAHSAATFRESAATSKLHSIFSIVGVQPDPSPAPVEPGGQSEAEPTSVASTPTAAPQIAEPTTDVSSPLSVSPEPDSLATLYGGTEEWRKPSSMSWGDWKSKGGATPYWVSLSDF